ncbi:MAG: class I SAM-dependent methyltransferase [Candidatus Thorarchaeota archaeon]
MTKQKCSTVCKPETCDTFQFMAKTLKMKVLHPGGLYATKLLAEKSKISSESTILDVGCGSGRSDIYLARHYGCKIVGVDIDIETLMRARAEAVSNGVGDRVAFRLANANSLPFQDQTFDGAIFQAALIFTNKNKVLHSVYHMIRFGGFLGVVELAWKKPPTERIVTRVRETLCSAAINTEVHEEWMRLLRQHGFRVVYSDLLDHKFDFRGILRNEGLGSSLKITIKWISDKFVKEKMKQITNLFKEADEYLGYGIYVARKSQFDRSTIEHPNPRALGYTRNRKV